MATYLESLYNRWEKELQEDALFISDHAVDWLNEHPDMMVLHHNAHELRVASALVSASTMKYSKYSTTLHSDLEAANNLIQKAACGLIHKSRQLYRKVREEWEKTHGQQPPKN